MLISSHEESHKGMFSKPGRDSFQKYPLLRIKEEILENKKREIKPLNFIKKVDFLKNFSFYVRSLNKNQMMRSKKPKKN